MLKLSGMPNTPSLPSLLDPLWREVVAPDRVVSMDQIELNCVLMQNWLIWNRTLLILNCVWTKTILIQNWIRIVWLNRSAWDRNVFKLCSKESWRPYSRVTRRFFFQSLLHWGVGEGATPFRGLLHFTLVPYLIMLSVNQGGIKNHFLCVWYDSTWDWTPGLSD